MPDPETSERTEEYRVAGVRADGEAFVGRPVVSPNLAQELAFGCRSRGCTDVRVQVSQNGGRWVDLDEGEGQ